MEVFLLCFFFPTAVVCSCGGWETVELAVDSGSGLLRLIVSVSSGFIIFILLVCLYYFNVVYVKIEVLVLRVL